MPPAGGAARGGEGGTPPPPTPLLPRTVLSPHPLPVKSSPPPKSTPPPPAARRAHDTGLSCNAEKSQKVVGTPYDYVVRTEGGERPVFPLRCVSPVRGGAPLPARGRRRRGGHPLCARGGKPSLPAACGSAPLRGHPMPTRRAVPPSVGSGAQSRAAAHSCLPDASACRVVGGSGRLSPPSCPLLKPTSTGLAGRATLGLPTPT